MYSMGDHEGTIQFEYDDISMKTKLVLTQFYGEFTRSGFDEKSFFQIFY